ncbi:MAG: uroporphyrinogen-III C-methyltransferase [Aquabacterium sp.]|uniref:uroporphyrinogen-III C-methyltransferase n=1 Tax=Aquabacterium sp. TaxID=1872578 RepID=UPI00271896C1|nr:uroporphyrinogen-III C-methyltransferase [Aquabacterium sp.]MDO9004736.1 uroporphyrinogen-III C-methyltransferase [Aquabacterium sp.]
MSEPDVILPPEPDYQPVATSDWMRWAVLVLSAVCVGGAWLAWTTQKKVDTLEQELVRRQQDSQGQATEARLLARQAQEISREAAARTTLLETRLAEVTLQRSQVEDLIKSMSLSRDENLVVDIEAALRVAVQQSALTGSAEPLIAAMKSAEDRLSRARQPRLDSVRRSLAKDLDRLKSTRVADLSSLTIRLDEAIRLVDELPLISQPVDESGRALARPTAPVPKGKAAQRARPAASAASSVETAASAAPLGDQLMQWGQSTARTAWQEAQALVRITRIRQPEAILITPEQSFFLRENLKLRLLNARLALLSRQSASAVADVNVAQAALTKYFDTQSRKTQLLQSLLTDVATQSQQTLVPRPDDTLASLAAIAGGR